MDAYDKISFSDYNYGTQSNLESWSWSWIKKEKRGQVKEQG
jgi:hypothetical protein